MDMQGSIGGLWSNGESIAREKENEMESNSL